MLQEDVRKRLERYGDRRVVNENIIDNPDREIDDIIVKCYSNLKYGMLAAWSVEIADLDTQYHAEFSAYLYKMSENKKVKKRDDNSIDINNFSDSYKIFRFKYIVKPHLISDKYRYNSYQNTINEFFLETSGYQHVQTNVLEFLKASFEKELEADDPIVEFKTNNLDARSNLFTKEQIVIVPIMDKTNKYIINGTAYYGVYNNIENARITSKDEYFFKLYRNGQVNSHKCGDINGILYFQFYGTNVNPFILFTKKNIKKLSPWDIISKQDDERVNEVLLRTYEDALIEYDSEDRLEDEKRLSPLEERDFIDGMIDAMLIYCRYMLGITTDVVDREGRKFEQSSALDEEIYAVINSTMKGNNTKKMAPSIAVKRINLNAGQIITLIKVGSSGKESANRVFVSATTDPTPLDIFHQFMYIRKSQHTQTKTKIATNRNIGEDAQHIHREDMKYLGQFAPKSAKDYGATTILHFNLSDDNVERRIHND